jgi:heat-inducible transcriptional repressor
MSKSPLNNRSKQILKALITRYIREGQPVGSKTIAEDAFLSLSPATIRSILADLEEAGYLMSPHTSAGRVPTALGYRFFVNNLLQVKSSFACHDYEEMQSYLNSAADEQELIESASSLISSMTKLTGIITVPRHEQVILRHIEFLPLSQHRILVIMVLNEHEVQNLIIKTDREYSESELQQAAHFLMVNYTGQDLLEIRQMLLSEMRSDHVNLDKVMQAVFSSAEKRIKRQKEGYIIAGESNLLNFVEETSFDQLKLLFDAFSKKNDILHLLDQCIESSGIQIFIGRESGCDVFDGCSLVTAPYTVGKKVLGVLGVIGPTRMDYERVICAVDLTAKLLSAILKERF